MPFRPLKNAVVVKLWPEPEEKKVGLIVIPQNAQPRREQWQRATIVMVGNGRPVPRISCPHCAQALTCETCGPVQGDREAIDLAPGDEVFLERGLDRSGFMEMHNIEGEQVWLVPEGHIQVKVEKEEVA